MMASLMALALGIALYLVYDLRWHERNELAARWRECRAATDQTEAAILAFVDRYAAVFSGLALVPSVSGHNPDEAAKLFARLAAAFPETENIAATDRSGCFFASARPLRPDTPCISQIEFFRRLASGAPLAVMQPHKGPITGEKVTGVVTPIAGPDGSFNGVVGSSIKFSALTAKLDAIFRDSQVMVALYTPGEVVHYASGGLAHLTGERLDGKAAGLGDVSERSGRPGVIIEGETYMADVLVSQSSGLTILAASASRVPAGAFFQAHPEAYLLLTSIAVLFASAGFLHWRDRQSFKELAASEDRFRAILEHSPAGVTVFDARTGRCSASNRAMGEILGTGQDHLLALNFRKLPVWRKSGLLDLAEKALAGEGPQRMEFRQTSTSGKDVMLDCLLAGVDAGEERLLVLIASDISEKTRMREVMVQTEKMMNLGGLAAGMAHEINNPLSGILQGAQTLGRRLKDDTPRNREAAERAGCSLESLWGYLVAREVYPLLDSMAEGAKRAAVTVANMLQFSRKTGGTKSLADPREILDKAVRLCLNDYNLRKKYDFRKVRFLKDYQEDVPLIPCAANQIEQVVVNLIRNAAQAMDCCKEGAPTPTITLRAASDGRYARMEVEDNGPGMSEDVRARVFEPFFSTKEPGEGTGLGLSVSAFIITENHGGRIDVRSEPGKGTTFIIALPVNPDAAGPPSAAGEG
jgi:PAS domain S-box-containing protein